MNNRKIFKKFLEDKNSLKKLFDELNESDGIMLECMFDLFLKENKSNYIEKVLQFHREFNGPIMLEQTEQFVPHIPSDRVDLRLHLIVEELHELEEAIKNNDIVEVLDAFVDLQYVLTGAVIEFGMRDIFDNAFEEVHRSNMSKACESMLEVEQTIKHYGCPCDVKSTDDGKYIVYRSSDLKALKSINYSSAHLSQFIDEKKHG